MTYLLSNVVGKCKEWNGNRTNTDGSWKYISFGSIVQERKWSYFKSLASVLCTEVDLNIHRNDRKMIHQGIKKDE